MQANTFSEKVAADFTSRSGIPKDRSEVYFHFMPFKRQFSDIRMPGDLLQTLSLLLDE
jgi:hypothetical protein